MADQMTEQDARRLTEEIKADAAALWTKLLALYDGGAHTALGYSSWRDYCATEFDLGSSQSYRVLEAGRVIDTLTRSPIGESARDLSEAAARELAPLKDEPQLAVKAYLKAKNDVKGKRPTAKAMRAAVRELSPFEKRVKELAQERPTPVAVVDAVRRAKHSQHTEADAHLLAAWESAHALERHVKKWGLRLGSLDLRHAIARTALAEQQIAQIRGALQEHQAEDKEPAHTD